MIRNWTALYITVRDYQYADHTSASVPGQNIAYNMELLTSPFAFKEVLKKHLLEERAKVSTFIMSGLFSLQMLFSTCDFWLWGYPKYLMNRGKATTLFEFRQ